MVAEVLTEPLPEDVELEKELAMRDAYADELQRHRRGEHEVGREILPGFATRKRADLLTVDSRELIRVWEFKIRARANALGQLLVYLALCRRHYREERIVRPVLAAAEFDVDLLYAIEALNLGVEVVKLPPVVLAAGHVPFSRPDRTVPAMPL